VRSVVAAWFVALTAVAGAAEVRLDGSLVHYTGDAGRNAVTVSFGDADVAIEDRRQPVAAGEGCTTVDAHRVTCPAGPVLVDLGAARDRADVRCSQEAGLCGSVTMHGGPGADSLQDAERPGVLDGGPGNDSLDGWGGRDVLRGGPGNDVFRWSGSGSSVDCGAGTDEFWPHVVATVTADCERFRDVLGSYAPTDMRIRGNRLVLTSHFVPECPLQWRMHAPSVFSKPIGYARVRAVVPLPGGIRAPFLHARLACEDSRFFPTLFRLRL
jgi:hypothetical protein